MRGDGFLVLAVLVLEAAVGYPQWLYTRIRHPVVWIGTLIRTLDASWNRVTARRSRGIAALLVIIGVAAAGGVAVESLAPAVAVLIATSALAQRSLYVHVRDVHAALDMADLETARTAVGKIVGRDTSHLDPSQIAAAALESLSESYNDAVVAPTFWLFVGGLPGVLVYKAVNTADSMIGHKEERWRLFGWAAARLDDVLNWIPVRCAGVLLTLAAGRGLRIMLRDARKHASPNAGWPEAALAGALAIQLGGPATYDGVPYERAAFGEGPQPTVGDLREGLSIYIRACGVLWSIVAACGFALHGW